MRTSKLLIALAAMAVLASCDVKDPIYDTDHPDKGKITLTADWSGIGAGIIKPTDYDISVAGYSCKLSGDCNTLDKLFDSGTYTGLAWSTADKITVNNTTATVDNTSGVVDAQPGWLFTARDNNVVIEKGKHHQYTVAMCQQVRQLTLVITPSGGTAGAISGISGSLSGVAGTLDIDNGTHGTPSNVALTFTKIVSGVDTGKWTATVRLLGIASEEQRLTGIISYVGGTPANQSLDSNMNVALSNFNADKKIPLTLGATVETPTEIGFGTSVTDWIRVNESIVAE